jgi:ribosomal protein L32
MYEYENTRRICYDDGATFVPVCPNCGRFVKADPTIKVNEIVGLSKEPNGTCSKCGRIQMLFEGFIGGLCYQK